MKVIADYNVIDHDYIASGNGDYDYFISCNRLLSITITDYDYPTPGPNTRSKFRSRMLWFTAWKAVDRSSNINASAFQSSTIINKYNKRKGWSADGRSSPYLLSLT